MSMVKSRRSVIILYIALITYAVIAFFPIYFALISSVKDSTEIFLRPFSLPNEFQFGNFSRAIGIGNIGISFRNSVILTTFSVLITGIGGLLAGYVLSRFDFRMKKFLYTFFIAGLMIPIQSVIIPLSFTFGKLHFHDSYPVLILLFTAFQLPITIFILTGFLRSIPAELEEAAIIDGCSIFQIFSKIIVPLSIPGITTASVFNFLNVWNNLLFPLVFIRNRNLQVIALGLQSFFAERVSDYGGVMAAIVISIIPPIIAYILLQEKVERGMTAGAVKG